MRIPITVFACLLCSVVAKAQPSLALASGLSTDINGKNLNEKFRHIPVVLEFQPSSSRNGGGMLFKFQYYSPSTAFYTANAYTLNPLLPPNIQLQETIRPYIFTAGVGFRIPLVKFKDRSRLSLDLFPFSLSNQNTQVKYQQYDKTNYDLENPDFNSSAIGLAVSATLTYRKPLKKNGSGFEAAFNVQSPPGTTSNAYAYTYRFVAPLSLTIGCYFNFKKKK